VLVPESTDSASVVPRLPVRASIYIAPDGTVHFGALFEELIPVADALGSRPRERAVAASNDATMSIADSSAGS
jgi:hypothetical protein